jgi:GNAT superfamily N-acetyltransferase
MRCSVTTYYLEMNDPEDHCPSRSRPSGLEIRRAEIPSPELNRFFYTAVGGGWFWIDRLSWTRSRWLEWLARPEVETWVAYLSGTPAGYFELERQTGAQVELVYFGLLPQFVGKGIGGALLTAAIRRAWEMRAERVWVHTCSLDHPRALETYRRQGFTLYKQEEHPVDLPDQTPGPWPGWDAEPRSPRETRP